MIYLQPRKRAGSPMGRAILVVCAIVVVLGALVQYFRPSLLSGIMASIARPFWRTELAIQLGALNTPEGLQLANQSLQRALDEADVRLSTMAATETENSELKALMGRASTTSYVLAAVLKRPPLAAYDELVIDAGNDLGFAVGNNVYAEGDVLIGRVSQVVGQTSKVRLFSSPGETYSVLVGPNHAQATAVGRGGGQYEAELPRDIHVAEGDFVLAPALNDRPFGVVSSVLSDPAEPFEKVLFAPPVNLYQLRWVLVDPKVRLI